MQKQKRCCTSLDDYSSTDTVLYGCVLLIKWTHTHTFWMKSTKTNEQTCDSVSQRFSACSFSFAQILQTVLIKDQIFCIFSNMLVKWWPLGRRVNRRLNYKRSFKKRMFLAKCSKQAWLQHQVALVDGSSITLCNSYWTEVKRGKRWGNRNGCRQGLCWNDLQKI